MGDPSLAHAEMDYAGFLKGLFPLYSLFYFMYYFAGVFSSILFDTYDTLDRSRQAYWCSSVVSTLHAVYIVYVAMGAVRALDMFRVDDFYGTCAESSHANRVFIAYLAYDLTNSLYHNRAWSGWVSNVIHHACGIVCWTAIETHGMAHLFGITAILTETTTPFVNNRWFFSQTGMKDSRLYVANGLLMTLLWFVLRICLFGWLGVRLYVMRSDLLSLPNFLIFILLQSYATGYALQIFWFRKIFKGALKTLRGGTSKKAPKKAH